MEEERAKSYLVLARKWRPQRFDDVVGQWAISETLKKGIASGRIANAYLFSGQRGVGKTTMARIFAKALNCEKGPTPAPCGECARCRSITAGSDLDVLEIDGATYTRVDDVRELQEGISHLPYAARYKVYIIDEVHMLSISAFNALLKTLEEPPAKVVFIFATTEPEKIPETIKSRCQHFHFEPVSAEELSRHLLQIIRSEQIRLREEERDEIIEAIVRSAEGSVRDALVTLEQLTILGDGEIRLDFCRQLLGVVESSLLLQVLDFIRKKNTAGLLKIVDELLRQGRDLERFVRHFIYFLRDLLIIKAGGDERLLSLPKARLEQLQQLCNELGYPFLLNIQNTFLRLEEEMKTSGLPRFVLEFHLLKLTAIEPAIDLATFIESLEKPEGLRTIAGGEVVEKAPAPETTTQELAPDLFAREELFAPGESVSIEEKYETEEVVDEEKGAVKPEPGEKLFPSEEIEEIWEKLRKVIGSKDPSWELTLQDCRLMDFNESAVTIGVLNNDGFNFNFSRINKNIKVFSKALEEITGKAYSVRIEKLDREFGKKDEGKFREVGKIVAEVEPEPLAEELIPIEEEISEEEREEERRLETELLEQISPAEMEEQVNNIDTLLEQNPDLKDKVEKALKVFKGKIIMPKKKK